MRVPGRPGEIGEEGEDKYRGDCGYYVAAGGVLVAYGRVAERDPTRWRAYAPGQWLTVSAAFAPE